MSNFEDKFYRWQQRMQKKSDKEKHNFALTVAFIITAIVVFFVASSWYYRFTGNSVNSSFFTDIEEFYNSQKKSLTDFRENMSEKEEEFKQIINNEETVSSNSTTTEE